MKTLKNYIQKPKLIYDGPEPKQIYYQIDKRTACDLWRIKNVDENGHMLIKKDEIAELLSLEQYRIIDDIVPAIKIRGEIIPIQFCGVKKNSKYIYVVLYTLKEISPFRYQSYILAIMLDQIQGQNIHHAS